LLFLNAIVFPTILEKVKGTHDKRNEQFMRSRHMLSKEFQEGAFVMIRDKLRSSKSEPRYEGPFMVIRRKASGNYLLKALDGTEYVRPPNVLKLVSPEIVRGLEVKDTIFASVDRILDHRITEDNVTLYKVRWKNQTANFDSWLRHEDFIDYGPVHAYVKKDKNGKSGTRKHLNFDDNEHEHSIIPQRLAKSLPTKPDQVPLKSSLKPTTQLADQEVLMELDKTQTDAVGSYWRTMSASRRRTVCVSDDEPEDPEDQEHSGETAEFSG
jgi:hypothetical protein